MSVDLSFLLPTYNRCEYLKKAVESIEDGFKKLTYEIIIDDGGSVDDTLSYLDSIEDKSHIKIIREGRLSGIMQTHINMLKQVEGRYVFSANDDAIYIEKPFIKAIDEMNSNDDIGIVGIRTLETRWGNVAYMMALNEIKLYNVQCSFILTPIDVVEDIRDSLFVEDNRYCLFDYEWSIEVLKRGYTTMFTRDTGMIHFRVDAARDDRAEFVRNNGGKSDSGWGYEKIKYGSFEERVRSYLNTSEGKKKIRRWNYYNALRNFQRRYNYSSTRWLFDNSFFHYTYDRFTEKMIVFRNYYYDNHPDFYVCQKYPNELINY